MKEVKKDFSSFFKNRRMLWLDDEKGVEYLQVDNEKCIHCYNCINVYPLKKVMK